MKSSLQPGLSLTRTIVIDQNRTIEFMGEDARVYATPSMVMDMERTCRDLVMQHADAGEDSVGTGVSIKHLAASLPGMTVEIVSRLTKVEGRNLTFEVTAKDEFDTVGAGTHTRFVVDVAKTVERLKAKAAKRDALKK